MRILGIVALCAFAGGCASVTRGTTENLSVASTPSGAEAVISGLDVPTTCMTPCSVVVKRNADLSVTVQKPGFEPQTVQLTREIQTTGAAGFAGNVLLGGLVGMGVDAATGAARDHKPNPVIITLQPNTPHVRSGPPPRKPRPQPTTPEAGT